MSMPDTPAPDSRLSLLLAAEPYWISQAMQLQGSRFFRALGEALDAADARNRRLIYATWTAEVWEFYERGLRLEAAERERSEGTPGG